MKKLILFAIIALIAGYAFYDSSKKIDPFTYKIWPKGAPQSNNVDKAEYYADDSSRVFNVSEAEMFIYPAPKENNKKIMVLICPGGGYAYKAIKHEGFTMAQWLNEQGISAAVLKYRIPNGNNEVPLADAQQAMKILRDNAGQWRYNKNCIGVMGFSAGGHLASTLGTHYTKESRPDFMVLFYPVISLADSITHQGTKKNLLGAKAEDTELVEFYSNNLQVTGDTPPAIMFLSQDDSAVVPENSILFDQALKSNNID